MYMYTDNLIKMTPRIYAFDILAIPKIFWFNMGEIFLHIATDVLVQIPVKFSP